MSNAPQHAQEILIELRWSDQDLMGILNNAKLMTLVEEARVRSLDALLAQIDWSGSVDAVLRKVETDFLRPVHYKDAVKVLVWVSKIGNTSYTVQHELIQDGQVCMAVEAVVVLFDAENQAPQPIPDEVRAVLETVAV